MFISVDLHLTHIPKLTLPLMTLIATEQMPQSKCIYNGIWWRNSVIVV